MLERRSDEIHTRTCAFRFLQKLYTLHLSRTKRSESCGVTDIRLLAGFRYPRKDTYASFLRAVALRLLIAPSIRNQAPCIRFLTSRVEITPASRAFFRRSSYFQHRHPPVSPSPSERSGNIFDFDNSIRSCVIVSFETSRVDSSPPPRRIHPGFVFLRNVPFVVD